MVSQNCDCIKKEAVFPFQCAQYNIDSFKAKEVADDNFEFDKNVRKFSKRVENAVGKVEFHFYKDRIFMSHFSCSISEYGISSFYHITTLVSHVI